MRRRAIHLAAAVLLLAGPILGCRGGGGEKLPPEAAFDYSMRLSGYDVPRPASVPFDDPEDAHEYLFFYHSAYWLTANHPDLEAATEIRPRSHRPAAAQRGWEEGQRDAREAKAAHWRQRQAAPTTAPAR